MTTKTWIIEPHDPLIVRDGRPFGANPGARAISLAFPFPSTTTGALRTQAGRNTDGVFDKAKAAHVLNITVRGPLLAECVDNDDDWQFLAPAPADALLLKPKDGAPDDAIRKRLVPLKRPDGAATDLDEQHGDLALVGLPTPDPRKPNKQAPSFWRWAQFEQWLTEPAEESLVKLADLGHNGPVRESRIHIRRDPDTGAAADGALFETSGIEFTHAGQGEHRLSDARRLALVIAADADPEHLCNVDYLGGERRLVMWNKGPTLPACLDEIKQQIINDCHCRVVLLTPACFCKGFRPTWLCEARDGVTPRLAAIAVSRPQVVSGWDFAKCEPKPTRRLAPAGTVLFLKLDGERSAIAHWIDATWMQCISDGAQDRSDGFGLAALGSWDGQRRPVQM